MWPGYNLKSDKIIFHVNNKLHASLLNRTKNADIYTDMQLLLHSGKLMTQGRMSDRQYNWTAVHHTAIFNLLAIQKVTLC